ncbi:MAG: mercuric reductase [candidate division Zixibacteria bacterium]|nr:mercuric reductase [candidate division Zixibacteria bacterium]
MGRGGSVDYKAIVIGTGQGGKPLAGAFAVAKWNTAIVECGDVGGTCVNVGCTPTKTMVASARVAYLARRGREYGVECSDMEINLQTVRERKRKIVDMFRGGSERGMTRHETLELIRGTASFTGPKTLSVALNDGGTREIRSDKIFINAGTRPLIPDIEGLSKTPYLTSTTIMELGEVPEHLLVIGGGYIGVEFGQMFRRFGSEVTIIQRGKSLLGREDEDVAAEVLKILTEDGVKVILEARPLGVSGSENRGVEVTFKSHTGEKTLSGSHLLVSVGRVSNADTLNLSASGIETDSRGNIKVNDKLETSASGVWALGDVNGGPAFTHISYDDFRVLKANIIDGGDANTSGRLVPYCVYTDPQLGRVGLTERQAKEQGLNYRVAKIPMTHVARALEMDETRGFMKAIVDADTEQILGAAVLGIEGGEVMSVLQMAMMGKVPYTTVRDGVFAHPTLAESLNNLFMAMDG